ncbi:MAG: hypothetical protein AAFR87_31480 [Bacteroidota bacterium]
MNQAIQDKIREIFQEHRQNVNLPFEEEHFLDFLLAKDIKVGSIRNSFRGLARYNRFMEAIQMEFGICLKVADKEKTFALDEFVEKVEEMLANPQSSKAAMRYLLRRPFEWKLFLFLNAFLIIAASFSYSIPFLFMLILMILMLANGILINIHFRDKRFARSLAEKVLVG